jgi:DNA-binding NarL/FixJ family response regulator
MPGGTGAADRLLIVDDHEGFRSAARALLESEGFVVVGEAGNGADAVLAAVNLCPDLVLLDVLLPDSDGFAVAHEIAKLPHPPAVLLVSSHSASSYGERVDTCPALGFVTKRDLSGGAVRRFLGQT